MAVARAPVGALVVGAGRKTGGLRRRLVAGRTRRNVPAGLGEADPAAAGRSGRFFGLRELLGLLPLLVRCAPIVYVDRAKEGVVG